VHPDGGGDVARADEAQDDQPGGDEAVVAEPGSGGAASAAAAGDGGEITTAGTDSAEATAAVSEKDAGLRVYGDSAYGTGAARAAYRDAGHETVIKPKPLRPAVPAGSPSTNSPSTSRLAQSPARPDTPDR